VFTVTPEHWKELLVQLSYQMANPRVPSENDLKQIAVPTLIIWGDRDQFVPIENAVELVRWIPNAQLSVIPKADHFVSRTHIDQFANVVEEFVQSL